ncbi:GAF domain-containing sensor histidine kinase [Okeanomitos corallinicola TIOX110]|uniref:histidine kinase n=1 Tax=Okeanomitos corallinicola TIOX110 TaxID=3133117 RepID=A0ABZ2UPF7_9CYAN
MIEPKNQLFIPDDGWNYLETKEQQRIQVLSELGLRQSETIPVFEEATQTAAHFLTAEISILGFIDQENHWFTSSVGLSRLGLMNDLAQKRQLLRRDSFCSQVVESSQILVINDTNTTTDPLICNSKLVKKYGIRSYLGVPLIDVNGWCLGTLAVMERNPRHFTEQEMAFLQIIARWSMSEFERNRFLQNQSLKSPTSSFSTNSIPHLPLQEEKEIHLKFAPPVINAGTNSSQQLKLELLDKLTQELRTPLTSVLGMTSVLGREIYGPLTSKQREYLEIIQHSGKYLLSLVNEINELGTLTTNSNSVNLSSVDIEMLCQQAIKTLSEVATRREQDIRLSVEPGHNRLWSLDKDKVKQIVYHLLYSMVQLSPTGSIVHVHISYKENNLCMTIWVSHPWLGEVISEMDSYLPVDSLLIGNIFENSKQFNPQENNHREGSVVEISPNFSKEEFAVDNNGLDHNFSSSCANMSREKLGLLLSCQLAELHGGEISLQGSAQSGYRYLVSLPLQAVNTGDNIH